jgi:ketosteroid isomerase-like protein
LFSPLLIGFFEGNFFMRSIHLTLVLGTALLCASTAHAQTALDPFATPPAAANLLTQPTLSPGILLLYDLEKKFAKATLDGGGKAFATWFAEDAVTIGNKQAPVVGRAAIAAQAQWDPKQYQLQWTPQGGQMLPAGDAGYTWGHYEGRALDAQGNAVTTTGRYITLWKRQTDGTWKVALDISNEEPADCNCSLPAPGTAPQSKP